MIGKVCVIICVLSGTVIAFEFGEKVMIDNIIEWKSYMDEQPVKNEKCYNQLIEWISLLENSRIMEDNWAWRMLDSANKINPGILTGNIMGVGNYDECLAINTMHKETMEIKGKYCFPIPIPMTPREKHHQNAIMNRESQVTILDLYLLAICLPHECSLGDFISTNVTTTRDFCQTADTLKGLDGGDWAFIVFLIVILSCVILSTTYDWYLRRLQQQPIHPITLAFSFYTNGEKLLKISNNPEQIKCLDGIRSISMMWVLAGHRYSGSMMAPMLNLEQAAEWSETIVSQYIQAAPLAVDSFLFLTGVLLAYGFMKSQSKPKAQFNIFLYYIHRYLRLTPAVAVLYFFSVTMFKHMASGPMWPGIVNYQLNTCLDNPLSYFLYIQNWINPETQCLSQTWYLSVDMQLFIISPFILLPMVKFPKYAGYAVLGLVLLSVLPPTLITYYKDIVAFGPEYNKEYYVQPYTRASPWLVGMLLGYILYQLRDRKVKIHKILNACIWLLVLVGMFLIMYFGSELNLTTDVAKFAVYNGLHRMFWSVGLMWIVFACKYGYGGIVNWFLSLSIFQILGRISYSMYLIHGLIQMISTFSKQTAIYFTDFHMLSLVFSDIVIVTAISFFYCMMFESPMVVIEKIIFAPQGWISKVGDFYMKSTKGKRPDAVYYS